MKVFQIMNGFCYWDASPVLKNAGDASGKFAPDMIFVDAPDYVFEGWGFNENAEGDARFIKPEPPEGWLYDGTTGTFYEVGKEKPANLKKSSAQLARENRELKKLVDELEAQLTETQLALCEMYEASIAGKDV